MTLSSCSPYSLFNPCGFNWLDLWNVLSLLKAASVDSDCKTEFSCLKPQTETSRTVHVFLRTNTGNARTRCGVNWEASKPQSLYLKPKIPHTQCKRHAYYTTQGPRLQFYSSHTCLMCELLFWMLFTYLVIARKVHATSSACCHAMQCMLKGDSDILLSITQDLLMFLFLFHCVLAGHQKISHSTFLERTVRKKGLWIYVAIRSWGRGIVIGSSIHNSW